MKVLHLSRKLQTLGTLSFVIILMLISACGSKKGEFRLKGKVKYFREGEFYIYSETHFDTIRVKDFKFDYRSPMNGEEIRTMLFPNFQRIPIIAASGLTLNMQADAKNFNQTDISGNKENKELSKFMQKNGGLSKKNQQRAAAKFIRQNPDTRAAEAVWRIAFVERSNDVNTEMMELLKLMRREQPRNGALTVAERQLESFQKAAKGRPTPSFSGTTALGKTLTDKNLIGKWTLISFWANWHYDSYNQIRLVRALWKRHKSQLQTVNISLDTEKNQWKRTINRDSIPEFNLCDTRGLQSPFVRTFGVHYLPCNILANPKGIIVARDLSIDEVEKRIDSDKN